VEEKDPCSLDREGSFLGGTEVLSSGEGYPFRPQDIADLALGEGFVKFGRKTVGQLLLGEGGILSFLLAQPGPAFRRDLGGVTVAVVYQPQVEPPC
jgi:hypothetical protein